MGLGGQVPLAGVEVNIRRALDIVLVDIAQTAAQRLGCRGIFGTCLGILADCRTLFSKALLGAVTDHCRGLQVVVLELDLARHQASALLHCFDRYWQAVEQRIRGKLIAIEAKKPPASPDFGSIADGDHFAGAVGARHFHPVAAVRGDEAFDLGAFGRGIYG